MLYTGKRGGAQLLYIHADALTVMVGNPIVLRGLLGLIGLACSSCLLPPVWLVVDSNDAGTAKPATTSVNDAATRTQAVTVPMTMESASMPSSAMMTPNDGGGVETASSNVGAAANSCISCASNQVCAVRANDMAGVCVDPHAPCIGLSGTAICDPNGVIYKCGPGGTIGGQQTCASLELCRVGLADGRCPMCAPGSYRCTDRMLLHCSADGASLSVAMQCVTAALCDGANGKCLPAACEPRASTCKGNIVSKCNPDGTAVTSMSVSPACDDDWTIAKCNLDGKTVTKQACSTSSQTRFCVRGACAACLPGDTCTKADGGIGACSATGTCGP